MEGWRAVDGSGRLGGAGEVVGQVCEEILARDRATDETNLRDDGGFASRPGWCKEELFSFRFIFIKHGLRFFQLDSGYLFTPHVES